jgi:hypothetical protein
MEGGHVASLLCPPYVARCLHTASATGLAIAACAIHLPRNGISDTVYRIGTVGRSRSLSGSHREGQPGGGLTSSAAPVAVAQPVAYGAGTRPWRRTRETHHAAIGTDRGRASVLRTHQAGSCGDHRSAGRGSQSARRSFGAVENRRANSVRVILCGADRQPLSKTLSQCGYRIAGLRRAGRSRCRRPRYCGADRRFRR